MRRGGINFYFIVFVFCLISCNRVNSRGTAENSVYSNESREITNEAVIDFDEPSETELYVYTLFPKGIINTDCNYYDQYGNARGRLTEGENIIIFNGYFQQNFIDNNQDFYKDVALEVKLPNHRASMWVQERYIDYSNNDELFTSWFKNKLFVMEYYYTGTPEDIFNNDWYMNYSEEDTEERLVNCRTFYSKTNENTLRISEKYLIISYGASVYAYRLKSVVKDRNIYTLNLSDRWGREIEVTLVDNGDGITIAQYNIIIGGRSDLSIGFNKEMLNIKYVPYDKDKSEKTETAIKAWCKEQLKILNSKWQ